MDDPKGKISLYKCIHAYIFGDRRFMNRLTTLNCAADTIIEALSKSKGFKFY